METTAVTGITVNTITTTTTNTYQLMYNAITESMEGAALHYVCLQNNMPFLQIRGLSNYIGERNKTLWKIEESLHNIGLYLKKYVNALPTIF